MRMTILAAALLCGTAAPALAQVSVSIGIELPALPRLVRVPGYPVYYAPQLASNYFFYDGAYWVYARDGWYASDWYNGPWRSVDPEFVPLFVLRVPVRYYRAPPSFFQGWRADAAPRWGDHWGRQWEQQHRGWDRWNHRAAPAPAPLPSYQRRFEGHSYPQGPQQQDLRERNYRWQPRDPVVRQQFRNHDLPQPQERTPPERGHDNGRDKGQDRGQDRGHDKGHDRGREGPPDHGR